MKNSQKTPQHILTIAIITMNRRDELVRCIQSLESQTNRNFELIVFDNNSNDGTQAMLNRDYPEIQLIESPQNIGCPAARNRAIEAAKTPYVLSVDDDGTLPANAVAACLKRIQAFPDAAVIAGLVKDPYHRAIETYTNGPVFTFSGGICIINREIFLFHGGYHEDGLRQGEELEFAFALYDAGQIVYLDVELQLDHHVQDSPNRWAQVVESAARQTVLTAVKAIPGPILVPWILLKQASQVRRALKHNCMRSYVAGLAKGLGTVQRAWRQRQPVRYRTAFSSSKHYRTPSVMPQRVKEQLQRQ